MSELEAPNETTVEQALDAARKAGYRLYSAFGPHLGSEEWKACVAPLHWCPPQRFPYRPGYGKSLAEAIMASVNYVEQTHTVRAPASKNKPTLEDLL